MLKLKDLQARAGTIKKEMRSMIDGAKEDFSPEQAEQFDKLKKDLEGIEQNIERTQYIEDLEKREHGQDKHFETETREYSLVRAIAGQAGMSVDDGREREVSQELARRNGMTAQGILVPTDVFLMEQRQWTGITTSEPGAGPGSNIIPTDYRPGQFIDILRAKLVVKQLGARVLSGLRGNVDIPKLKASATVGWVAENSALTPSDMQFDKVQLTPKHAGCLVEFSRNMLMQSSPDIEQLVRMDFAALLARALDGVSIEGGGANEPDGILEVAGVQEVDVNNGWTWAKVLEFIEKIEEADATANAWLTEPKVVKTLRSTHKTVDGEDEPIDSVYLMEAPNSLAGYPLRSTTLVPDGKAIFGNFSDLLIGYWSAFDVLVNPYESDAYKKGNVMVRGMMTCDVALRHPESFCKSDLGEE